MQDVPVVAGHDQSEEERGLALLLAPHRQIDFDAEWTRFRADVAAVDPARAAQLPEALPRLGVLSLGGARIDEEPPARRSNADATRRWTVAPKKGAQRKLFNEGPQTP